MKLNAFALLLPLAALCANAEDIVISTDNTGLVYNVADNGRVYQKYFGKRLSNPATMPRSPMARRSTSPAAWKTISSPLST